MFRKGSKPIIFTIEEKGEGHQKPEFKLSRNSEMKLPEPKDKGKIYTLKPLPTFNSKEKVIK